MNEFNFETDYMILVYTSGVIWLIIAMILAYRETINKYNRFKIISFLSLTIDKTIFLALDIISAFSNSKGTSSRGNSNSEKVITKVQFRNGYAYVSYTGGSYSIHCSELVTWSPQSITVKIQNSSSCVVETRDPYNRVIDTYIES